MSVFHESSAGLNDLRGPFTPQSIMLLFSADHIPSQPGYHLGLHILADDCIFSCHINGPQLLKLITF